jgi:hypothetical protein
MADDRMPSFHDWLAEYRERPAPEEVVLYQASLPVATTSLVSRRAGIVSLRIACYDDPAEDGVYLFSENEAGDVLADTWHEDVEDAFEQAEFEFGLTRSAWQAALN